MNATPSSSITHTAKPVENIPSTILSGSFPILRKSIAIDLTGMPYEERMTIFIKDDGRCYAECESQTGIPFGQHK